MSYACWRDAQCSRTVINQLSARLPTILEIHVTEHVAFDRRRGGRGAGRPHGLGAATAGAAVHHRRLTSHTHRSRCCAGGHVVYTKPRRTPRMRCLDAQRSNDCKHALHVPDIVSAWAPCTFVCTGICCHGHFKINPHLHLFCSFLVLVITAASVDAVEPAH